MNAPNLFKYATKELSQDAFICWLLAWADKLYKEDDLHDVGMRFLRSILIKFNLQSVIEVESIEIRQQYKRIDILCLINTTLKEVRKSHQPPANSLAIIIEDKVGAGLTGDQLNRYFQCISNLGFNENQILRIYLRTKDLLNLSEIEKANYKAFTREDFLTVLQTYTGPNHILNDFKSYWGKIEKDTVTFQDTEYSAWDNNSWMGFYRTLKTSENAGLNQGNNGKRSYGKNAAPTYGPLFKLEKQGYVFYMRICKDKLNLIVKVTHSNNTDQELIALRNKWLKKLTEKNFIENHKIERPARVLKRLVKNKELTIGCMSYVQIATSDNKINIEQTLANLNRIGQFMQDQFVNHLHVGA